MHDSRRRLHRSDSPAADEGARFERAFDGHGEAGVAGHPTSTWSPLDWLKPMGMSTTGSHGSR